MKIGYKKFYFRLYLATLLLTFTVSNGVANAQETFKNWQAQVSNISSKADRIVFLDSITKAMIKSSSPEQVLAIKMYMKLSFEANNVDAAAQKSRFLIQYLNYQGETEKAEELLDSVLALKHKFKQEKTLAHLLLKRAGINYQKGDLNASIHDYEEAIPIFFKANDSIFAADGYYFTAQAYADLKQPVESVKNYNQAYKLYKKLGDLEYAFYVQMEMSDFFHENGMTNRAIEIWEDIYTNSGAENMPCIQVLAGGNLLREQSSTMSMSNFEKEIAQLKALNTQCYSEFLRNKYAMSLNWQVIDFYTAKKLFVKADSVYNQIKDLKFSGDTSYSKGILYNYQANYLDSKNKTTEAIALLANYLKSDNVVTVHKVKILEQLVRLLKKTNKNEDRIIYSEALLKLKDSLYKASVAHNYALNQSAFELDVKDAELEENKSVIEQLSRTASDLKHRTLWIIAGVILVLALSIISIIVYKRRVKRQIAKNEELVEQIDEKTVELDQLIVETVKEFKKREVLTEQLKALKTGDSNISVNSIITDLKASKTEDEKKLILTKNLKKVSSNFSKRLKEAHPSITKTELEIINFMKLGMTRNEIAQLRNTSLEAVKKSRARIKKKLGLAIGESLDDYIENF